MLKLHHSKLSAIFFAFVFIAVPLSSVPVCAGLIQTEVSQLYVAIFGRASEGEGNRYWQAIGLDKASVANAMLETDAAKNYFGLNLNTDQAFIEHIYRNTLNKTSTDDPAGIAYWVGELQKGNSRGYIVATLVGVIKNYAPGGQYYQPDDAVTVAAYNQFVNRVEVSNYMADRLENPPENWEQITKFDSNGLNVNDDFSTIAVAKTNVDYMSNGALNSPGVSAEKRKLFTQAIANNGGEQVLGESATGVQEWGKALAQVFWKNGSPKILMCLQDSNEVFLIDTLAEYYLVMTKFNNSIGYPTSKETKDITNEGIEYIAQAFTNTENVTSKLMYYRNGENAGKIIIGKPETEENNVGQPEHNITIAFREPPCQTDWLTGLESSDLENYNRDHGCFVATLDLKVTTEGNRFKIVFLKNPNFPYSLGLSGFFPQDYFETLYSEQVLETNSRNMLLYFKKTGVLLNPVFGSQQEEGVLAVFIDKDTWQQIDFDSSCECFYELPVE